MDRMREMGDVTTNTVEVYPYAGEDWRRAIDAVITAAIRARKGLRGEAVVGFGHSLGGSLLYAASTRVPGLFDSLVLFDSPLFHPMKRAGILLLQKLRLMELLPLVIRARRRRSHFESFEEATQYILSRRLYQSFHPEVSMSFKVVVAGGSQRKPSNALSAFSTPSCHQVLEALMDDGLVETEDGDVCFAFSPEAEARFFKGTPTDLHPLLNPEMHVASRMRGTAPWIGQYEQSRCPGTYIFSNRHEFLGPYDIVYLQQALQGPAGEPFEFEEVREGHYMPLQDLDATADMLACLIDARHGLRRRRKLRVAFAAPEDQGFLGRDSDTQEENILRASSG
eukprot:scaffold48_cov311-Pinguiococcus_pyrenoidosus.AAC.245